MAAVFKADEISKMAIRVGNNGAADHWKGAVSKSDSKVMGREGKPSVAEDLTGDERLEEILLTAVRNEKDSILFYQRLKDLVPPKSGKDQIDEIVRQKRRRIVQLTKELEKLKSK
jgi:hypothetical protein